MNNWRIAIKSTYFNFVLFTGLAGLLAMFFIAPMMVAKVQLLKGVRIHDPILSLFNPVDVSGITSILINGGVLAGILYLLNKPKHLVMAINCYWITTLLRMFTINWFPLEAPAKVIVLSDPFLNLFVYKGAIVTKDLFFSGHVSTMFILFLNVPKGWAKILFLANTFIIAGLILLQHVHYTIDVIAALPISYAIYRLVELFPYQQKTVDN